MSIRQTTHNHLTTTKIEPEAAEVKRAVVWYSADQRILSYIELIDKDGRKLLKAGAPFI
jgi:hypothetical protein